MKFSNNLRLPKLKSLQIDGAKQKPLISNIRRVHSNASDKLFTHQPLITEIREKEIPKMKSYSYGVFPIQLKQKYVSKSPGYFRKHQKSMATVQPSPKQMKKVNTILEQKFRSINKQSMLQLAKKGLINNQRYKHKIMSYKQSKMCLPTEPAIPQIQTKYSTFSPTKMGQLRHSLQRIQPPVFIKL